MKEFNLHLPKTFTTDEGNRGFRTRPGDWLMMRRDLHVRAGHTDEAERVKLLELAARLAPDHDGEVHLKYDDAHQLLRQVALSTVVPSKAVAAPRRVAVLKVLMGVLCEHHQQAIRDEVRGLRDTKPSRLMAR
jgi:hypothetical protein